MRNFYNILIESVIYLIIMNLKYIFNFLHQCAIKGNTKNPKLAVKAPAY